MAVPRVLCGWGMCLHKCEIDDRDTKRNRALDYIRDLGAVYVRTDIYVDELVNENHSINLNYKNWWDDYISAANARDLELILILNFKKDGWLDKKYSKSAQYFMPEWRYCCAKVAQCFGDRVYYYQILNEENHPLSSDCNKLHKADECKAFKNAHQGLAQHDSDFKTIVNVYADWLGWANVLDRWCRDAGNYIDVLAIDHYPGTYNILKFDNWTPLEVLINKINNPNDPCYGKQGAITETGFSTWYPGSHKKHKDFVNTALPKIRRLTYDNNSDPEKNKIIIACLYELRDNIGGRGIEGNFGILCDDWKKKPAYDDLKTQIARFR